MEIEVMAIDIPGMATGILELVCSSVLKIQGLSAS